MDSGSYGAGSEPLSLTTEMDGLRISSSTRTITSAAANSAILLPELASLVAEQLVCYPRLSLLHPSQTHAIDTSATYPSLAALRLVNRFWCNAATPVFFRYVRISLTGDSPVNVSSWYEASVPDFVATCHTLDIHLARPGPANLHLMPLLAMLKDGWRRIARLDALLLYVDDFSPGSRLFDYYPEIFRLTSMITHLTLRNLCGLELDSVIVAAPRMRSVEVTECLILPITLGRITANHQLETLVLNTCEIRNCIPSIPECGVSPLPIVSDRLRRLIFSGEVTFDSNARSSSLLRHVGNVQFLRWSNLARCLIFADFMQGNTVFASLIELHLEAWLPEDFEDATDLLFRTPQIRILRLPHSSLGIEWIIERLKDGLLPKIYRIEVEECFDYAGASWWELSGLCEQRGVYLQQVSASV